VDDRFPRPRSGGPRTLPGGRPQRVDVRRDDRRPHDDGGAFAGHVRSVPRIAHRRNTGAHRTRSGRRQPVQPIGTPLVCACVPGREAGVDRPSGRSGCQRGRPSTRSAMMLR
jgi:hypothetical protein